MAAKLTVDGIDVSDTISALEFQEDATPLLASDSSGGVGQITVTVGTFPDAVGSYDDQMVMTDTARGTAFGIIRDISETRDNVTFTADALLEMLRVERTARAVATMPTQNLVTNPGVTNDISGWSVIPGTGGVAGLVRSSTRSHAGGWSARANWTTATTAVSGGIAAPATAVSENTSYSVSAYASPSKTQRLYMSVEARRADGSLISSYASGVTIVSSSAVLARFSVANIVTPKGTATLTPRILAVAGTSGAVWNAGDLLYMDSVQVEPGAVVRDYRDGSYANWAWLGTPGNSASAGLPYSGGVVPRATLKDAWAYYATELCGLPAAKVLIGSDLLTQEVTFPGWSGDVWTRLKQLCTVYQLEIAALGDSVILRSARTRNIELSNLQDITFSGSSANSAQSVEVVNYNAVQKGAAVVYPENGVRDGGQILQVNGFDTAKYRVTTNTSILALNQPQMVARILPYPYVDGTGPGIYTVIGSDNLPITPAFWKAYGGAVTVATTENPNEIEITLTGPSSMANAPYRIAESDGSNQYPALYVTGSGVYTKPETLSSPTGVDPTKVSNKVGITIDIPFIGNADQASRALRQAIETFGPASATISGSLPFYNTGGNEYGNVAGSMFNVRDCRYRITSTNFGLSGFTFSATRSLTAADLRAVWADKTATDFRGAWADKTARDFDARPLKS